MESFLQGILTVSKLLLLITFTHNYHAEMLIRCHMELRMISYGVYSQRF